MYEFIGKCVVSFVVICVVVHIYETVLKEEITTTTESSTVEA